MRKIVVYVNAILVTSYRLTGWISVKITGCLIPGRYTSGVIDYPSDLY
jgi:hypothetical protein